MDFITEFQLQNYESVINSIQEHFEDNKKLKIILENENNKIFLQKLRKNNMISKLTQVNVKIFRNVFDLYFLYDKEIPSYESLKTIENCKFYLIEIYLTKLLLQKLRNIKWSLLITVFHENGCTSKVIKALNKMCIRDVLLIEENIIECVIEVDLIMELDQKVVVNVNKTEIDISYHFSSIFYSKQERNRTENFLNITKLYNEGSDFDKCLLPMLNYELKLNIDVQNFIKMFITNCYHSMNIELLEEFDGENKNKIDFTIYHGQQEKYSIIYNKHIVLITANYLDLHLLKKYFCKIFHNHKSGNYKEMKSLKVRLFYKLVIIMI